MDDLVRLLPPDLRRGKHLAARNLIAPDRYTRIAVLFHRYGDEPGADEVRRYPDVPPPPAFHDHELIALGVTLAGRARLRERRGAPAVVLEPGCLFSVAQGPSASREGFELEPSRGYHDCALFIAGDHSSALRELGIWDPGELVFPRRVGAGEVRACLDLFRHIGDFAIRDAAILRRAIALADRLLGAGEGAAEPDAFADRACRLLREHPEPGYRMHEAAAALGMGYETFRKRFRHSVGMAPAAFQLRERMNRACTLLREHGVLRTAVELGYSDAGLFSRQFKQVMGMSPKHFL